MTEPDSSQQLAEWLRAAREAAQLTTYELAERMGITQSRASRLERGLSPVTEDLARAWAEATGTDPGYAGALVGEYPHRPRPGAGGIRSTHERGMAELRRAVTCYSEFGMATVPELLQVPGYAAAVAEKNSAAVGEAAVAAVVARRMNDQSILYDPERSFSFVIAESALRYPAGPPQVMRAQAEKINTVATLPNVSVAVLSCPADSDLLIRSGFAIYEAAAGAMVLVELLGGERVFTDELDVQRYRDEFAVLRKAAVAGRKATQIISALGRR